MFAPTSRRRPMLVIVGVVAVLAVACSADGLDRADDTRAPDTPVSGFGVPTAETGIEWEACEVSALDAAGLECGWLAVPLDHADPDGATIDLAVARLPASGEPAERIGSLVVNPGGPGMAGSDFVGAWAPTLPEQLLERFDLVGFDPRGVGRSAPLHCLSDAEKDARAGVELPRGPEGAEEVLELHRELVRGCLDAEPELVEHLSTADAATDMDLLRAALGDDQLTYVGISYGTRLGAVYATMFPDRVRALVLDAAVSPDTDPTAAIVAQAAGFEQVQARFVAACNDDPACALGPDAESVLAAARDRLEAGPIEVDTSTGPRQLNRASFDSAVIASMYSTTNWGMLARAIDELDGAGAATLLALGDRMSGRSPDGTWSNQMEATVVINCSDTSSRVEQLADGVAARERVIEASDLFGPDLGWGVFACADMPLAAQPTPDIDGAGASPILVIGGLDDPATPYQWAEQLSAALDSGVLVTWEGAGHGSFPGGGECVVTTVSSYLIDLEVPDAGLRCAAEADQITFAGLEGQLLARMTGSGVPAEPASCAIDSVVDRFGPGEFDLRMLTGTGADELLDAIDDALDACA